MRKVKIKTWIPSQYPEGKNKYDSAPIAGTGCFSSEYTLECLFHQWCNSYEESDKGFGNYTYGLVEFFDGTLGQVMPQNMKFLN